MTETQTNAHKVRKLNERVRLDQQEVDSLYNNPPDDNPESQDRWDWDYHVAVSDLNSSRSDLDEYLA